MTWKRVLYEDQGVSDNYVDVSFLKDRRTVVQTYQHKTSIYSSIALLHQFCVTLAFVLVWLHMSEGQLTAHLVLFISIPTSVICYVIFFLANLKSGKVKPKRLLEDCKTGILLLSYAGLSSPILKTLTDTISTDTVYAMTAFMLLGHCLFLDYGSTSVLVSRSVSLNMAIFAAVCLASRLESILHTYATIILALALFGLWPMARRRLAVQNPAFLRYLTAILFVCLFYILHLRSLFGAFTFFVLCFSVTFVFPGILVVLQSQKNNIYGPWDEAVISK